jgi:hypothetical protein
LPKDVLVEAEKVAQYLGEGSMLGDENSESSKVAKRRKAVLKVVSFAAAPMGAIYRLSPVTNNIDSSL